MLAQLILTIRPLVKLGRLRVGNDNARQQKKYSSPDNSHSNTRVCGIRLQAIESCDTYSCVTR